MLLWKDIEEKYPM